MLLSMTGFGEARRKLDSMSVAIEVRTINSRYFKISIRCGDGYGSLETLIENVVREQIKRGTVQVDPRTNTLIITNLPERVGNASDLIAVLDRVKLPEDWWRLCVDSIPALPLNITDPDCRSREFGRQQIDLNSV